MSPRKRLSSETDGDGDQNEADKRPAKRAKSSSSNESIPVPGRLQNMMSFLVEERRKAAEKYTAARRNKIPRLIEQLVILRKHLDKPDRPLQVLLDKIVMGTEAMIACMNDLKHWIILALPASFSADEPSLVMKNAALETIAHIEEHCIGTLKSIPAHHLERDKKVDAAARQMEPGKGLQDIYKSLDKDTAWECKVAAGDLLAECEKLVNFLNRHRRFLEIPDIEVGDTQNLYL